MTYVVIFPRVKRETATQFLIDRVAFRLNFLTVMQHLFGGQNSLEWMSAKVKEIKIVRDHGQKNRFDSFLIQVKMQLLKVTFFCWGWGAGGSCKVYIERALTELLLTGKLAQNELVTNKASRYT